MNGNNDEELYRLRRQMEKTQQDIEDKARDIHLISEGIDELYDIKRHSDLLSEGMTEMLKQGETSAEMLLMEEERQGFLKRAITEYEYALEKAREDRAELERDYTDQEYELTRLERES